MCQFHFVKVTKTATEDEMVGWHHQFNGHELGQTPGDGEGQASLVCCSPWGREESDMTWQLNNSYKVNSSSQSWNIERKCGLSGPSWGELAWSNGQELVQCFVLFCCHSVAKVCPTLCNPMDCSMPYFPVLHYLPEFAQTHVYWVSNALQPSHPLSPPSPLALNLSQHQGLFQWVGSLHQVPKYWSFSISPSNEHSRLISFRIDWFDLLAVQGTLKSLQLHSSKTSVLWHSAFFVVHLSHPYMTSGKAIACSA